jgi:hypothetical protein
MRTAALVLVTTILSSASAMAAPVYSQPGTQACNPSCWTSHYGSGSGFRTYDNFTLASAKVLNEVSWQGIYIPLQGGGPAPSPNTASWQIDFYSDAGNFPGASLYSLNIPAANVTTTFLSSGFFGSQPVNLYSFKVALPLNFGVVGGTQYWFSPLSLAASFDPFFSWSPATLTYDGLTAQTNTAGSNFLRPNDRAFALGAIPEPQSWAMLIAGFGLVGAAARRRRVVTA